MTFIAFLRGINVGGHKRILMNDLKTLFEIQGFTGIRTYIQSGNVLFHSTWITDPASVIETHLQEHYGWDVPVFCYTIKKLKSIMKTFPFTEEHPDPLGNRTYLTLFKTEPKNTESVNKFVHPTEKLVYSGKAAWIYCPGGYGKSKLSNSFLEQKLNLKGTTRNLRTMNMMVQMAEESENENE